MLAGQWRRLDELETWPTADTLDAAEMVGRGRGRLAGLLDGVAVEGVGSAHRAGSDEEATAQAWW